MDPARQRDADPRGAGTGPAAPSRAGRRPARRLSTSTGFYDTLAGTGLQYGPSFQGRAAPSGGTVTPSTPTYGCPTGSDPAGYGIHPALLDAALHPMVLAGDAEAVRLPFVWSGVTLHASARPGCGCG